ncbi:MAG: hypothetical protein QM783_02465 [Phycisphaerales bacterium]
MTAKTTTVEGTSPRSTGFFGRLSLKWKLGLGFAAVLTLTAGVAFVGWRGMRTVQGSMDEVAGVSMPSIQGLLEVRAGAVGVRAVNGALMVQSLPPELRSAACGDGGHVEGTRVGVESVRGPAAG